MKNRIGLNFRIANRSLVATMTLLSLTSAALLSARANDLTAAEQCDREAGSEFDLERNKAFPAVSLQDIHIGIALSACREAYNQDGGPRIQFQLARALDKAGQKLKSLTILAEAARNGHALAMVQYGDLLAERGDRETAFSLYRRAAAQGNELAARTLAVAYREGGGTNTGDVLSAQQFARVSADQVR